MIVVGMGPAGAGTAAMLREPAAFRIAGEALDVLALEARSAIPTRSRVVGLQADAQIILYQADELLGRRLYERTAPDQVASIARIERTLRAAAAHGGADVRYGASIASIAEHGWGGVEVTMADGAVHRGRYLVDASGGRLGPFVHGEPTGQTVYLTGNLPARPDPSGMFVGDTVRVHGAGNEREWAQVFGFTDAREGATAFLQYPSLPSGAQDATRARRLLRLQLERSGIDPRGLRDAQFIVTPHVSVPSAVDGALLAVGDSVRRVSPRTAAGVSNSLLDARGAAWAIQDAITGRVPRDEALAQYATAAARRG